MIKLIPFENWHVVIEFLLRAVLEMSIIALKTLGGVVGGVTRYQSIMSS